ncbi:hypothetical protein MMIC_P1976 [Mariprofundus micogutta]|uniref:Right handed beta helix domain-containing protein n=1 Tax=Mariprofundus micogutta TaxID=1921010 RepID=A0A1L8CQ31_9PROT|nr:DUF4215 domain-containing protein [Mariprofundus micogutta]GAV20997.1 hypothetical protein MMIC_P1976 [Mariprofundus micogutta]
MPTFKPAQALFLTLSALLILVPASPAEAGPYRCENGTIVSTSSQCNSRGGLAVTNTVCGNGYIETGEVCDNGTLNTDNEPDGCRTDCRRYWCGDGVVDSNEQCDSNYLQHAICSDFKRDGVNYWGGELSCHDNCSYNLSACHYCGDGITQSPQEQCDDGNAADDDGCNRNCTSCISLNSNLEITSDTEICTQNYAADDYGDLGVIIIKAPDITLDCDFARLTGQGDGIGIYIKRSDNVTVKNCLIDNYEFGIYAEDSDNIQVLGMGNKMTNTTDQLVLDNSTAAQAAAPTAAQFDALSPRQQVFMQQRLQTRRVPSRVGDSLKMKAMPGALTSPSKSATTVRTPMTREEKRKKARETRMAERKAQRITSTPASAATSKSILRPRPERSVRAAAPLVTFPKNGQRFTAPATLTVKARFDRKRKVIYSLRQLPGKRVIKTSARGSFRTLTAGSYCVAVAYAGKGEKMSPCIAFSVVKPERLSAPVRQLAPLMHRP